jgi:hypothetical protein
MRVTASHVGSIAPVITVALTVDEARALVEDKARAWALLSDELEAKLEILERAQLQADRLHRLAARDRVREVDLAARLDAWRELPAQCDAWDAFGEGRCTFRGTLEEVEAHRARHEAEGRGRR